MVADAGVALCRQQVARRGGEELPHHIVVKDRCIGDVDDDVGARHRVGEALAGDGVDAGGARGRHRVVSVRGQSPHEVHADAPAPTDDHDVHDVPSGVGRRIGVARAPRTY